ncbi:MAG: methyltransferase domain-containing protein [Myxococcota bacterium]|nr:methyltransferase domain-containing protein [Myxococcota bacterium]
MWARFTGRGAYPPELAFLLKLPGRGLVLSPRRLVRALALAPAMRVLELGPGPGYFSPAVAATLPRGQLVLADLQAGMLRRARRHLRRRTRRRRGPAGAWTGYVQTAGDRLALRDASFDRAFLVAVLGEVPDPGGCVRELARVLRPAGRLLVAELPGDPDALVADAVRAMGAEAGLVERSHAALPGRGFLLVLERPPAELDDQAEFV